MSKTNINNRSAVHQFNGPAEPAHFGRHRY
jgi:hypothetical protein